MKMQNLARLGLFVFGMFFMNTHLGIAGGAFSKSPQTLINTELALAAMNGQIPLVRALLDAGADPNHAFYEGNSALKWAIQVDSPDLVKLLLENNADPNLAYEFQNSWSLNLAAREIKRNAKSVFKNKYMALLERGQLKDNYTPLTWACHVNFNPSIIKLLLEFKANPNQFDERGSTPLNTCIASLNLFENQHQEWPESLIISLLLEAGADPNLKSKDDATPLSVAITCNRADALDLLLRKNADPNLRTNGFSPIHIVSGHTLALAKGLLQAGADINARTKKGETPLMNASWTADVKMVKFLLDEGADPNLISYKGKSSLDLSLDFYFSTLGLPNNIMLGYLQYEAAAMEEGLSIADYLIRTLIREHFRAKHYPHKDIIEQSMKLANSREESKWIADLIHFDGR